MQIQLSDEQILEKASDSKSGDKIRRLYDGDISDYGGDHSAADQALCCHFAWWFNGDSEKIDRVFRASGLMRKKWDEVHYSNGLTYGQNTVQNAIQIVNNGYNPTNYSSATINYLSQKFMLTDTGNGELFADQHSHQVRFCHPWKKWLTWDGKRWKKDDKKTVLHFGKQVIKEMYRVGQDIQDQSERSKFMKHVARTDKVYKIKSMMELATADQRVSITPDEMDQDKHLLNLINGTLLV